MGSHNVCVTFKDMPKDDLKRAFSNAQAEAEREYGTDAYNGTISTLRGLLIEDVVFETEEMAEKYILNKTEKWGPGLAVRVKALVPPPEEEVKKARENFLTLQARQKEVFDGLNRELNAERDSAYRTARDNATAHKKKHIACGECGSKIAVDRLSETPDKCPVCKTNGLGMNPRQRKVFAKKVAARDEAHLKLNQLQSDFDAFKRGQPGKGTYWFVAGWAAS